MSSPPIVELTCGRARGARGELGLSFLGLPYATAQRWAVPAAPEPWAGERNALTPGPAAPQPDRAVARFTHGDPPPTDEDCLNLSVFTPGLSGERPVLVWVHGGGFAMGHGAASLYNGARLAVAADIVVISINYRLGSLGWLCHPDLARTPGEPAGNWGLLDQIAALRWVRENVAAFGGDPRCVTVAGQSAGALSALDLLAAPDTEGLFSRLILQSPPLGDLAQPADAGQRWARALSRELTGGTDFDPEGLRALHPADIVAAHERLLASPEFAATRGALPTLEPATLPESPLQEPGARPEVDIMIGANRDEGTFFFASPWRPPPAPERIPGIVSHLCPGEDSTAVLEAARATAAAAGRPTGEPALLVEIATQWMLARPVHAYARARARALAGGRGHGRVYRYRVDHPGAGPQLGATHTAEVPLLFGTWRDGSAGQRLGGMGPDPTEVARAIQTAWGRFARGAGPGWEAVGEARGQTVGVFGGPGGGPSILREDC